MPIYMNISGIEGDSTNAQFKNWFELSSFSWGESQSTSATGGGGGTGKVSFSDLSFTKTTGKGSPLLFLACANGKHLPAVQLVVTAPRKEKKEPYLKIVLTDVLVSSYQIAGDAGGLPQDDVSLNFAKLEFDQSIQQPDGSTQVQTATWDIKTNRGG